MTLDLEHKNYMPYRKSNTQTVYVNRKSNHPAHILNHIPVTVNKRLQKISRDPKYLKKQPIYIRKIYEQELNFSKNVITARKEGEEIWYTLTLLSVKL